MKKDKKIKALSSVMGAAAVVSSMVPAAVAEVSVQERAAETYDEVANVNGTFSFRQDVLTPADDVFNLFGTAATAACAKPGFAFDKVEREEYFVNVGGKVKKNYTVSLKDLKNMQPEDLDMRCTCGMSSAIAMANVKGVKVADMLAMAEVDEDANTITFKDDAGYGLPMPLSYVLDKDAMLVYQIGDKELPDNAPVQVWMPDTIAKYFTRRVTDIELTASAELPVVEGMAAEQRAKVSVLNTFDEAFNVGDQISFQGYADDCGTAVTAVEFSLDGGKTWTAYDTASSNTEDWIYWNFDYVAQNAGTYKLDVRARTEDGTISPLASSVVFTVAENGEKA